MCGREFKAAFRIYLEALEVAEQLDPRSPDHAFAFNQLGLVLIQMGQYEDARSYHAKALDMRLGHSNPFNVAISSYNLGVAEYHCGDLDNSLEHLESAIETWTGSPRMKGNLLQALKDVRQIHIVKKNFKDTMRYSALIVDLTPSMKPDYIPIYMDGIRLMGEGQFQPALDRFREALASVIEGSPDHGSILNHMGLVLMQQGNLDEAEKFLSRAIEIRNELGSPIHIAESVHNLSNVEHQRGNADKAMKLMSRAINLTSDVNGAELLLAKSHLCAANMSITNDPVVAQRHLTQARRIEEHLQDNADLVSGMLNCEGLVLMAQQSYDDAKEKFQEAVAIVEAKQPESLLLAECLGLVGSALTCKGDEDSMEESRFYTLRAVAIYEKLTPGSVLLANVYGQLAIVYEVFDELQEALDTYRKSVAILEKIQPHSVSVLDAKNSIEELEWEIDNRK
jgi:tetratricopeptide (TPR) repeat protein